MYRPRPTDDLETEWTDDPRWEGIRRDYSSQDVARLRGSVHVEHTLRAAAPNGCGSRSISSRTSTRSAR